MNTIPLHITDAFADSLSSDQLRHLSYDADATHITEWKETSENKIWRISGHARQLSPNRTLVWSVCDEADVNDVELNYSYGDDAEQEAADHAHKVASELDGRGVIGYVLAIVSIWERGSDKPREVTEDTISIRLQEWIDGDGDGQTVQVARALFNLI